MGSVSKDHYYKLASELESERISAAADLIKELSEKDSEEDWDYAIDRLIKGLGSQRASARLGFLLCLGEILAILINDKKTYTVEKYIQTIEQKLNKDASKEKGKNLRSSLFGRLFGYQSLLNAGVLKENIDEILAVYKSLFDVALTKPWIKEICFVTIYKHLLSLKHDIKRTVSIKLLKLLNENNLLISQEGVLIYLAIKPEKRAKWTSEADIDSGSNSWKNGNPLTKGNIALLSKTLGSSEVHVSANKKGKKRPKSGMNQNRQSSSWSPHLHYVWGPLFDELLSQSDDDDDKKKSKKHKKNRSKTPIEKISFSEFWKPAVDEQFFKSSASPEKKYLGFEILSLALSIPYLLHDQVQATFSPNLLRSLVNQSAKDNRVLHAQAKVTLKKIVDTTNSYEERKIPVLKCLLEASSKFDRITKSKTVQNILNSCNSTQALTETAKFLVNYDSQDDSDIVNRQIFATDSMLRLVRANKELIKNDCASVKSILDYLIDHAFFVKKSDNQRYTERISKLSLERLYSVLSEAMSSISDYDWPKYVVLRISIADNTVHNDGSNVFTLRVEPEQSILELKTETFDTITLISDLLDDLEESDSKVELLRCFEILFSTALIELYTADPESVSILSDLRDAFANIQSDNKIESEKIMEILIDLMLSYVNQKSTLMKKISFTIWQNLVDKVNKSHLQRLFDILLTRENKQGQSKLFDQNDVEETAESEPDTNTDDEDEDKEDTDDVMEIDGEDSFVARQQNGTKDSQVKIDKIDQNTSKALSEALGVTNEVNINDLSDNTNENEEDDDEEDLDSDGSMSDEEMMALDSTLSQIFKQRRAALEVVQGNSGNQRKLEAQDARNMMIFFKSRVLDLLDIFHNRRKDDTLNLDILLVLIDLIALTMDKDVGNKAHKLIRKICKDKAKLASKDGAFEILEAVQQRSRKSKIHAHCLACNQASLFILKQLDVTFGNDAFTQGLDIYYKLFKEWIQDPSMKTTSAMFVDVINWANNKRTNAAKENKRKQ